MKLILRRAGSEVRMREVNTGHVAVSVVEFRAEGWTVPERAHGHTMDDFRCDSHLSQDGNESATAASYVSSNSISQGGESLSYPSSHSSEAVM
eukprot:2571807-Pyramimonas_sp.AAC.1